MLLSPWTSLHYQKWSPVVSRSPGYKDVKLPLKFFSCLRSGYLQVYRPECRACKHQYVSFLFPLVYFILQWPCKVYTCVLEGATYPWAKFWQRGCYWCFIRLGGKHFARVAPSYKLLYQCAKSRYLPLLSQCCHCVGYAQIFHLGVDMLDKLPHERPFFKVGWVISRDSSSKLQDTGFLFLHQFPTRPFYVSWNSSLHLPHPIIFCGLKLCCVQWPRDLLRLLWLQQGVGFEPEDPCCYSQNLPIRSAR